MPMDEKNIKFKYNPNFYKNGILVNSKGKCECCGKEVEGYIDSIYCIDDVSCICLDCLASGKAAEKFNATFVQGAMPLDDKEKRDELFHRTPGYSSWQGEYWLTCCNDYCAFIASLVTN